MPKPNLPQNYIDHLNEVWSTLDIPAELKTDEFRDWHFAPCRWLYENLIMQGFNESYALGIQHGCADYVHNLNRVEASFDSWDYVQHLFRSLTGMKQEPIMSTKASVNLQSVVLNENMKTDDNKRWLYTIGITPNWLGAAWGVGVYKNNSTDMVEELFWLDTGETVWGHEVVACVIDPSRELPKERLSLESYRKSKASI